MNAQLSRNGYGENLTSLRLIKSELKVLKIEYNSALNVISVTGWSSGKRTFDKYFQVLDAIETHLLSRSKLNLYFKLNMLDVASTKLILKIIKKLNRAYAKGREIRLFWSCNTEFEEEMIATGLDLRSLSHFPFEVNCLGKKY